MPKTIISILGTAGRDYKTKEPTKAHYDCSTINVKDGEFYNATDVLLHRYTGEFFFIGTEYAIAFQKELLGIDDTSATFIEVKDDSLDEVFERVLELLSEYDDVLLDVTHGFRHQPIMAIFAATLSQFLDRGDLSIIYAKVVDSMHYAYIYLDNYVEISQISLLLTGFIRTLNFIPVSHMRLLDNKAFEGFSKSLLANDLRGVEKRYASLKKELDTLEQNRELSHLSSLFAKVRHELEPLDKFSSTSKYEKYLLLSHMTVEKNYLVVALAYVFESLRVYCDDALTSYTKSIDYKDAFERKSSVMDAVTYAPYARKDNKIYLAHDGFYATHKPKLLRIAKVYLEIRKLRNSLAHINEHKEFDDIKKMLFGYIFKVESIYRDDILGKMRH